MKRFLLVIIAIIFLAGCTSSSDGRASAKQQDKKPRIPKRTVAMQADLSGLKAIEDEDSELDMDRLIEKIDKSLERQTITAEDIERGWYYAKKDEKKIGTPSSWIWIDEGLKSRWISPNAIEEADDMEIDELCRKTAGTFIISCVEREAENCEYISQSECRCLSDTKWVDDQGCILADEEGEFIKINSEELKRGWYFGLPNEKKLNTPINWIWVENGIDSRWQNPSPIK